MTIGTIDIDSGDALELGEWLKNDEVGEFQRFLEKRIVEFLFSSDPASAPFQQMIAWLAWIGATAERKLLLEREIAELTISPAWAIEPCKNKVLKSLCKIGAFIAEHKVEIFVGMGLCATGMVIAYATGYTLSVVVGEIIVAGTGSIFSEKDDKPNPHIPVGAPPCSKEELAAIQQAIFPPLPPLELPSSPDGFLVTSTGIWANGQFYSNKELLQHSLFAQELTRSNLSIGTSPKPPEANIPHIPETRENVSEQAFPSPNFPQSSETPCTSPTRPETSFLEVAQGFTSRKFTLHGTQNSRGHIGWINGINNTLADSTQSGAYLQGLANGHTVSGIYNCTHGPVLDVLEAVLLNYMGISPNTAKLLQSEWTIFHEANADRPNARLLQVCHSQGAIDVSNALEHSPPEIRDRVIVVAIAPAAIVPDEICFKSFNYASEKDFVHKFGPIRPGRLVDDVILPDFKEEPIDYRDQLIILSAHPDAVGIDHAFQSPTFQEVLRKALENYDQRGGEYLPEEKGR